MLRNIVIAMIVISMAVLGISIFTGDLLTSYGVPTEDIENFTQIFNLTQDVQRLVPLIENETTQSTVNIADLFVTMSQGAFTIIKIVTQTPLILHKMFIAAAEGMYIPSEFVWFMYAIIVVWIAFEIASAIFKWKT